MIKFSLITITMEIGQGVVTHLFYFFFFFDYDYKNIQYYQ